MKPEDELQAALAVDVACLHAAATKMLSRVSYHGTESGLNMASNAVAKLERAFHSAINTFYRVKRGNTQVIRVEKLEIQAGAQAVVGQVIRARE